MGFIITLCVIVRIVIFYFLIKARQHLDHGARQCSLVTCNTRRDMRETLRTVLLALVNIIMSALSANVLYCILMYCILD